MVLSERYLCPGAWTISRRVKKLSIIIAISTHSKYEVIVGGRENRKKTFADAVQINVRKIEELSVIAILQLVFTSKKNLKPNNVCNQMMYELD